MIKVRKPSYVYWTVHHLDSWIKRDQLDVTCFIISLLSDQHVSDVNTSILRSLWLICWVISWVVLLWFDVCWCYVVVWLGWCGICIQAEALVRLLLQLLLLLLLCSNWTQFTICLKYCLRTGSICTQMQGFRLPSRHRSDLHSSGMLHSVQQ